MKRLLALALAACLLAPIPAHASITWTQREKICSFRVNGRILTGPQARQTLACALRKWPVPGGYPRALCIAQHESGVNLYELAKNPSSSSSGVFQFITSTWRSAFASHPNWTRWWHLPDDVFNGRSNIVTAVILAHGQGAWWPTWTDNC